MSEWAMAITRLSTMEDLKSIAAEWDALLDASCNTSMFLRHVWVEEWWRVYGEGKHLWVLVARNNQGIQGIAPLMVVRERGGMVRRVKFLGDGYVTPNHLDLIAMPGVHADLVSDVCAYLRDVKSEWDLLDLDGIRADSPTLELLEDGFRREGTSPIRTCITPCPFIQLPTTYDEYIQSRGTRTRKKIRYERRTFEHRFSNAKFGQVETESEFEEAFDALIRLHQASWTARGYPGAFAEPRFTDFHRAVARRSLQLGTLRLMWLKVEGEVLSVDYAFKIGDIVFAYNSGINEAWADYSPGSLSLAYSIESSIRDGAREFDFLEGDEEYKSRWATGVRKNCRLLASSPSLRGRAVWAQLRARNALRDFARQYTPFLMRSK